MRTGVSGQRQLLKEHRNEVKAWKKDLGEAKSQIVRVERRLTEENKKAINDFEKQLGVKDEKLNVVSTEKQELEEKMNSLLDVLYGCCECGRHGDFCECNAIDVENDECRETSDPDCLSKPYLSGLGLTTSSPSPPPTATPVQLPSPTSKSSPPYTSPDIQPKP